MEQQFDRRDVMICCLSGDVLAAGEAFSQEGNGKGAGVQIDLKCSIVGL